MRAGDCPHFLCENKCVKPDIPTDSDKNTMASYYDVNKATSANQRSFILNDSEKQHFPFEGLYIGSLSGGEMELPALVDICEVKAFCMLYSSDWYLQPNP